MIELNLLPDVKLDYLRAERSRRLVLSVSVLVAGVAIAILVLLLLVDVAQRKHLSDLTHDITSESQTLEDKPDITKILTVQNQLESLTNLHSQKPAASLLFTKYLDEITPGNVSIDNLQIDFNAHTITISGNADSLKTVNQYVDTLKFTNYTTSDNNTSTAAFSDVVLASFGINNGGTSANQAASYTVNLSYDPTIFDITNNVTLSVPNITTTRSELEQPGNLFKAAPSSSGGQNG
jgi:Tfp pilus assembly protein PilN